MIKNMNNMDKKQALHYHAMGRPGKIEVVPTKPHSTQYDLSLAYSPGVAEPCLEIQKNQIDAYKYTAKSNLVAVISNGTAVLGLGDIGALSGKPVMEGKGLLFKIFADIDVFDIELDTKDVDKFIETVKMISPTFGGINLEDIKAHFSKFGSKYIGHPNNKLPGIEMNSGSLGHGLPVCVGMALAGKKDNRDYRVYTVMGDGELAEGSVWEGFMAGHQYKLDNLCAVIDRNRLQISGNTEDVMGHDDLHERIRSFGWHVIDVKDGNDIDQLNAAFEEAKTVKGKPTAVIANTVKGCGSSVMENKANWHHKVPTQEEYDQIIADFAARKEAALHE